jgi:hypothetical protein
MGYYDQDCFNTAETFLGRTVEYMHPNHCTVLMHHKNTVDRSLFSGIWERDKKTSGVSLFANLSSLPTGRNSGILSMAISSIADRATVYSTLQTELRATVQILLCRQSYSTNPSLQTELQYKSLPADRATVYSTLQTELQ